VTWDTQPDEYGIPKPRSATEAAADWWKNSVIDAPEGAGTGEKFARGLGGGLGAAVTLPFAAMYDELTGPPVLGAFSEGRERAEYDEQRRAAEEAAAAGDDSESSSDDGPNYTPADQDDDDQSYTPADQGEGDDDSAVCE
jgi:hypothetical protein